MSHVPENVTALNSRKWARLSVGKVGVLFPSFNALSVGTSEASDSQMIPWINSAGLLCYTFYMFLLDIPQHLTLSQHARSSFPPWFGPILKLSLITAKMNCRRSRKKEDCVACLMRWSFNTPTIYDERHPSARPFLPSFSDFPLSSLYDWNEGSVLLIWCL